MRRTKPFFLPILLAASVCACPQASPVHEDPSSAELTSTPEGAKRALALVDATWSEPSFQERRVPCPDGGHVRLITLWCDETRSKVTHETRIEDCSLDGTTFGGELHQVTTWPLPVNADDRATEQRRHGTLIFSGALTGECAIDVRVADPEGDDPKRSGTVGGRPIAAD